MLPRDAPSLTSLAAVARTAPAGAILPVGDPRQQAFQRALAGQVGQSMQSEVVAKLADGTYVVRVADMAARMPLPPGAQPGSQIQMTLVALTPRPTFQVATAQGNLAFAEAGPAPEATGPQAGPLAYLEGKEAAALTRASALLAKAAVATRAGGADGANASLSPAGKAIGDVLAAAAKAEHPATAAIGRTPLLPAAAADAGRIAAALRQGLETSGLFYESHVAEWAAGGRTLTELAAEPQARGAMPSALAPDTAQFINLQLGAHEQGRVAWQGQLWPGQDLRWEIAHDPDDTVDRDGREAAPDDADAAPWQSRLRLRFGTLGEVDARIVLSGDQLHIRLDAGPDAGARLRAAEARLAAALDAAGTPLTTLAIHAPQDASEVRDAAE
jgi:hypothetical protein